jgi:hypothetical protein
MLLTRLLPFNLILPLFMTLNSPKLPFVKLSHKPNPIWLKLKLNSKLRLLSLLNNKLLKKPPELVLPLKLKNAEFGKLTMMPPKNLELPKEK